MAIQYASYNDENMQSGKFYLVEVDKDSVSNLRLTTSITEPIQDNSNKIVNIENDISTLETINTNLNDRIVDNTKRINNLEDMDHIQKFIQGLDAYSSKVAFSNATKIEIPHNRKEIYFRKVVNYTGTVENEEIYQDITDAVNITDVIIRDNNGNIVGKKIVIESSNPITGYMVYI